MSTNYIRNFITMYPEKDNVSAIEVIEAFIVVEGDRSRFIEVDIDNTVYNDLCRKYKGTNPLSQIDLWRIDVDRDEVVRKNPWRFLRYVDCKFISETAQPEMVQRIVFMHKKRIDKDDFTRILK